MQLSPHTQSAENSTEILIYTTPMVSSQAETNEHCKEARMYQTGFCIEKFVMRLLCRTHTLSCPSRPYSVRPVLVCVNETLANSWNHMNGYASRNLVHSHRL